MNSSSQFHFITTLSVVFASLILMVVIEPISGQKSNQPIYEDYDGVLDPNDPNQPPLSSQQGQQGGGGGGPKGLLVNENFSDEASLTNAANADGDVDGDKSLEDFEQDPNQARTRFTDERFAKLFPSRLHGNKIGGRFDDRRLMPKEVAKPKPTLPSFIKSTPPLIKVQITTPSTRGGIISNNNLRQRSVANNQNQNQNRKTTTTSTTPRPGPNVINARNRLGGLNNNRSNQLVGRLTTSTVSPRSIQSSSTTVSPAVAAAAAAASRRRFQSSSSRFQRNKQEFNANSTIPSNPRGRS